MPSLCVPHFLEIHCKIKDLRRVRFESEVFDSGQKSNITVYVPVGKGDEYRNHPVFQGFKEIVEE